ncbi:unnamed protein product [Klebsiella pneumoniae subsp. rhinoscleromatis SB3432]|uniref:hypothetical protein n=1 Tax=Klebsiella pneumoniae TaxID=573 RepID=UPI0001B767E8|nr:hypothetical protein [Klebsiella pneumoniae]CCI78526.1 unnamed protein product [Klebsiella pneumoniae subsp. rhinoscleromatis SB3432]STV63706.1 Uncharacterised protein [Klebsiella pneumoniae subsp. rhinoscleromatis]EEW42900.1 hypothetical protein HMPREF0484_1018 [Klebsiella pneumoniae subsp. rhinoscleromatis ATCC 13884]STT68564.1 Uncharacterised protein [Klebsiella pneumoniae]STU10678.1 Uncharacterised protein [Klebsiella pneumoniae]
MHTRNVNVKTAAQESSRKMGGKPVSYRILVADMPKNAEEEWDVMEFSSLAVLKKFRRRCPEKMSFIYGYALSSGVDKQFQHINVIEADHFKQFVRLIEHAGIDI